MEHISNFLGNFETEEREFVCVEHGAYMSKVIRLGGETLTENRCPKCLAIEARIHEEAEARLQAEREAQEKRDAMRQALKRSCIPDEYVGKTFDNFEAVTPNQVGALDLAQRFVRGWDKAKEGGYGLLFYGACGTGKSHLGCAIIHALLPTISGVYTRTADLIRYVRTSWGKDALISEFDAIRRFVDLDLLVIDEVGVQSGSANEQQILFSVIDARLAENRPTILLTNLAPNELVAPLGERLVDRIKAKCVPFAFVGKSRRKVLSADVFGV